MEINNSSPTFVRIHESLQGPVIVSNKLLNLIATVKEIKIETNIIEVLDGLKKYILFKKLFDPVSPSKICCQDDELGTIFGVPEFTITDVVKFLPRFCFPVSSEGSSSSGSEENFKRKNEELDDDGVMKKNRNEEMVLYIPPSPGSIGVSDTSNSFQGYETAVVKDTSNDSFYLSHVQTDSDDDFSIVTVRETYDIEYEVESLSSSHSSNYSSCSDNDSDLDCLKSAIIHVICKGDSDMECWADKSSGSEAYTSDLEISDSDKWECSSCKDLNKPTSSQCLKCFRKRSDWFATSATRTRPKRKSRSKRKRAPPSKLFTKEEPFKTSQNDACENNSPCVSSSQESCSSECTGVLHSDPRQDSDPKLCHLCRENPVNGTIIHAHSKYAHTISCYDCAKKLQQQKKRCPICGRKISRVVCSVSS